MRIIRRIFISLGVLLTGSLLGLLALVLWVLGTSGGARWVLDTAVDLELADLEVRSLQGQLLGPLQIEGLHYRAEGVDVQVDHARLDWSPAALLRGDVRVLALELGRLDVRLSPSPEDPDSEPVAPRVPQLPIGVQVGRLRLQQLHLWMPGAQAAEVVEAIEIDDLLWRADRAHLRRLAAQHARTGPLQAVLQAGLSPAAIDIQVLELTAPAAEPAQSDAQDAPPRLQLSARGRVQLDDTPSELRLDWQQLRWPLQGAPQVTSEQGWIELGGTPDAVEAKAGFDVDGRGKVTLDASYTPLALAADLRWKRLQWPLQGAPQVASPDGRLTVSGKPEAYRYTLKAHLAAEGRSGSAEASGAGGLEHVVLETLNLAVARARVRGNGRVDWNVGAQSAVAVHADLDIRDLNPALIAADWPGNLNGHLKARTQIENQVPRAQFELSLRDSELRGYPLQLDARGSSVDTVVTLASLRLRSAGTTLTASGQVTPPLDLRAELDSPDLVALWPGLGGSAQLQLGARGALDAPHAVVQGQVRDLTYQDLSLQRVDVDADVDLAGDWSLDLTLRGLSGPTEIAKAQVQLSGRVEDHQLQLSVDAEPAQAELTLRGALDRQRWRWQGEVLAGRVAPRGLEAWTLEAPAALQADASSVDLEPACWAAGASRACARVMRERGRLRGAFRLEQLDFAYFAPFIGHGWALAGGADGFGLVELRDGRLAEIHTRLSTSAAQVSRDGKVLLRTLPGELRIIEEDGRATAALELPLENGHIGFDGTLGSDEDAALTFDQRALQARLVLNLQDLGFLGATTSEVEHLSGRIQGQLDWSGTLAQLQSRGELRLLDGEVDLATPGLEVRQIGLRVAAAGQALDIDGSARSGEGTLRIEGSARLVEGQPQVRLALRGEDFQAANMALARAWVSPRLDISLEGRRLDVRGEVQVPRADITPVSFDSGVGPSADQIIVSDDAEATGPGDGGLQVSADVRLVLGDQVSLDGYGLTTRLTGSVRAVEAPGRVGTGRGEVRLVGGRYEAYGQELDIQTGRLLFAGGPLTQPAVEIRAVRKPREDIEVGVLVRGTLDQPQFQLFSTPAMPRERQLSWLVLGRSIDDGGGEGERAMLANAALSLGLGGTDRLAQGLRGGLGLDEISIGSQPGEDAQQASFTVGKYLSPRLYVSYGVGIFQPGQIFRLLYELGGGFKVATESGIHTGGDLLYSVERP